MKKFSFTLNLIIALTLSAALLRFSALAAEAEDATAPCISEEDAAESTEAAPVPKLNTAGISWTTRATEGRLTHNQHILDQFVWDGHTLHAVCLVYTCGANATAELKSDLLYKNSGKVFYYCSGQEIDTSSFVSQSEWNDEDKMYVFTYAPMDGSAGWTIGLPTENGRYKLAIRMPESETVADNGGDYGNFNDFICVDISSGHIADGEWTTEGTKLCYNCPDCGTRLAEISIDTATSIGNACGDVRNLPQITEWYLDGTTEAEIKKHYPSYGFLFEGKSKALKKKYPLQIQTPSTVGIYNVYLGLYEGEFTVENVTAKTDPVDYDVKDHIWAYSAEGYSLLADCGMCNAHAEVCIDTSTVYQASRNFQELELQDYDVFYETDWSDQAGIASYSVLFTGKETATNTLYDRAFSKPVIAGNYDVRLALLSDEADPDSAYLSTKEKHFYLADISAAECDVITYGDTEIAQFPEPEKKDGYYQVGTAEELMWCVYKANATANIELTNDIVVNPITVDEDGNVYSARYQIYTWPGFGIVSSAPYTGNIKGNGYTVYGLYMTNSANQNAGFIDYGKGCSLSGFTVENSVIYGKNAGALAGRFDVINGDSNLVERVKGLNCYINGSSAGAGLISYLSGSTGSTLRITGCGSDSIVCGSGTNGAGGIVGCANNVDAMFIEDCYNLGSITATGNGSMAGGIIGKCSLRGTEAFAVLWQSFNTGSIKAMAYEGGIAGYLLDKGQNRFYFDNCTNTGYLGTCTKVGGIAGYVNMTKINCYSGENARVVPCYYMNAKSAYVTADSNVSLEDCAVRITKSDITGGFVCTQYGHTDCSHWDMISAAGCTKDGELQLKCEVCGSVLEDEVIRAYGHHFTSWGECSTCGISIEDYEEELAKEEALSGTFFGRSPVFIILTTAGVLLMLMAAWLVFKKKRNKSDNENPEEEEE